MHAKVVSTLVRARRTRMARRQFERRFRKAVIGVGSLYALATMVAPERAEQVEVRDRPSAGMFLSALQWRPAAPRPAASVLNRKGEFSQKSPRPLMVDTMENIPRATLTRWHSIYLYSTRYKISAELARKIYDTALRQKLEPELAFRVVNVESEFKTTALSPVGAIGLTQLMLATARGFEPNVTREELLDPETNLRIGFRYLRALIRENNNNLSLALLVYNRGPVAVQAALNLGENPTNGYDRVVTRGYRGRGILD
ncbi:MAG: transglycosylase SLT domain-containing protein [Phycisphaerae bacterium]|nr:transglycosylase SLT domain-containing protein [Gemmatimonadaceae bacterium]